MEWVLRSPQIHSTFGSLGYVQADVYHVNKNCNAALETILHNLLSEDKSLRTYRRNISFGQNIQKDILPLLAHAKDDTTIALLIKILVNLTIPVECLFSVEAQSKTDFGRHTIFEINKLLVSTKSEFTNVGTSKLVTDFVKKNLDSGKAKLLPEQCTNIANCLMLLRNILHIPEEASIHGLNGSVHTVQNQILWNLFSLSVDKMLIKLMTVPEARHWSVTMVQLVALLYKDQHVCTLHKLLNIWLETCTSDSSEDNESNTSALARGSDTSSPMISTTDSSDNSGSRKGSNGPSSQNTSSSGSDNNPQDQVFKQPQPPRKKTKSPSTKSPSTKSASTKLSSTKSPSTKSPSTIQDPKPLKSSKISNKSLRTEKSTSCDSGVHSEGSFLKETNNEQKQLNSRSAKNPKSNDSNTKSVRCTSASDCGYATQMEHQASGSTSSNEEEMLREAAVQKMLQKHKQRANKKTGNQETTNEDGKRKKIIKRAKSNISLCSNNVQGLTHNTPTDDDISNILKEFTVDFLLKGYNSLVQTLHNEILTNLQLEIDTSHFFWLVTYFLKFATQIELDLGHVDSVLCFDMVSYLTAEGVNLCEQFEMAIKLNPNDLKPSIRRLHLVVTAIREFVQAIEVYRKQPYMRAEERAALSRLQRRMCDAAELRALMVLLLRHYNPKYQNKQYLQDLIVTNHILLLFVDSVIREPDYAGNTKMIDHIRQFATPDVMNKYGLLLEDYLANGEFVNDCIFTIMHHVSGVGSLIALYQPGILKTFTSISQSEYEICDSWNDLVQYVINTFIRKPSTLRSSANFRLPTESFDEDDASTKRSSPGQQPRSAATGAASHTSQDYIWTEDEVSFLSWNYMQSKGSSDVIGELVRLFKEDGNTKSRKSILNELYKHNLVTEEEHIDLKKIEKKISLSTPQTKEMRDQKISSLCQLLIDDGKSACLVWLQNVLLEVCYARICVEKKNTSTKGQGNTTKLQGNTTKVKGNTTKEQGNTTSERSNVEESPVVSSVAYHSILMQQAVPLVPWSCQQAAWCRDLQLLQLLLRLGVQMPVDSGKRFMRIPRYWSADYMFEVAGKLGHLDTGKLKFSLNDLSKRATSSEAEGMDEAEGAGAPPPSAGPGLMLLASPDNRYQIQQKQNHLAALVNFTPMPGSSFKSGEGAGAAVVLTECRETIKRNWLEVVRSSHQNKITLNLKRETTEKVYIKTETKCSSQLLIQGGPVMQPVPPARDYVPHIELPLPPVKLPKPDTDDVSGVRSICDTESVASNLTRMYVSDEDELPLPLRTPRAARSASRSPPRPSPVVSSDSETGGTKRKRMHYDSEMDCKL